MAFIPRNTLSLDERTRSSSRTSSLLNGSRRQRRYVHRTNLINETSEIDKSWLKGRKRALHLYVPDLLVGIAVFIGLGLIGIMAWRGYAATPKYQYRTILDIQRFEDTDIELFTHEVQVGGFGNGVFDWTTNDSRNSYVKDGRLYIVPTLTSDFIGAENVINGYTVNLTRAGTCTGSSSDDCQVTSNETTGQIIPPVRSARLTTRDSKSLKYGRVEVTAKLPRGDWLWPAIWMMPLDSVYGSWPKSGEIDIIESWGNSHKYYSGGRDKIKSSLHWGPDKDDDRYYKTTGGLSGAYKDFSQEFHTYGLEWTDKYMYTYMDSRLLQILYVGFGDGFWDRGDFSTSVGENNSALTDIWASSNNKAAPFDQEFYLILNVDVGGTNGWFPDGIGDKPWVDAYEYPATEFWNARDEWYPTWPESDEERGMVIKSIKMMELIGM